MSHYTAARDQLNSALNFVTPDGPEWVKTMAAIGDVHRIEQRELSRGDPGRQRRSFLGRHSSPQVRTELAEPRRPPGS